MDSIDISNIYYRVPIVNDGVMCPYCGNMLRESLGQFFVFHNERIGVVKAKFHYCEKCGIGFKTQSEVECDERQVQEVLKETFSCRTFSCREVKKREAKRLVAPKNASGKEELWDRVLMYEAGGGDISVFSPIMESDLDENPNNYAHWKIALQAWASLFYYNFGESQITNKAIENASHKLNENYVTKIENYYQELQEAIRKNNNKKITWNVEIVDLIDPDRQKEADEEKEKDIFNETTETRRKLDSGEQTKEIREITHELDPKNQDTPAILEEKSDVEINHDTANEVGAITEPEEASNEPSIEQPLLEENQLLPEPTVDLSRFSPFVEIADYVEGTKTVLRRIVLTNTEVANIDEDDSFGPYKRLALSAEYISEKHEEDGVITVSKDDFGICGAGADTILTVRKLEDVLHVTASESILESSLYVVKGTELQKAIKINWEGEITIDPKDIILLLVPDYLPKEIYGGAEALYCLQLV